MSSRSIRVVLGLTLVVAAMAAAPAGSEPQAAAGALDFQAPLVLISTSVSCPADAPSNTTECRAVTVGSGLAVGGTEIYHPVGALGWVNATYTLPLGVGPPTCPADLAKPLATGGRLGVEGGEIAFTLAEGARCVGVESAWNEPQQFTITGGTGRFAGASGSGMVERGPSDWGGLTETWTGLLRAHRNPPELSGAVAKTVRAAKGAKSARVGFEVTATDDDGVDLPVSCHPRSGSRFSLGRTMVRCVATDSNGNSATATFTVTVKRRG